MTREQIERILEPLYDSGYFHGTGDDAHWSIIQTTQHIVEFVANWLEDYQSRDNPQCTPAADLWHEDMA